MRLSIKNRELQDLIRTRKYTEEFLNEVLLNALKQKSDILDSEKRIKDLVLSVANVLLTEMNEISAKGVVQPVLAPGVNEYKPKVKEIKFEDNMIAVEEDVPKATAEEIKEKKKGWIM